METFVIGALVGSALSVIATWRAFTRFHISVLEASGRQLPEPTSSKALPPARKNRKR